MPSVTNLVAICGLLLVHGLDAALADAAVSATRLCFRGCALCRLWVGRGIVFVFLLLASLLSDLQSQLLAIFGPVHATIA